MKIFKVKEILREKVRLAVSGSKRTINNKTGAWYEVVWFSNGDFELHPLAKCGIRESTSHIPFNPMTKESFTYSGWGDDKYDYNKEEI
jgi:hypothetical protein